MSISQNNVAAYQAVPSLLAGGEFHFFDSNTKVLILSSEVEVNVPDCLGLDFNDLDQVQEHLVNEGIIKQEDCLIAHS